MQLRFKINAQQFVIKINQKHEKASFYQRFSVQGKQRGSACISPRLGPFPPQALHCVPGYSLPDFCP